MKLQVGNSECVITPQGGRISSLVLDGVPILGTFQRIDGKSGNTHVCVPNFGSEGAGYDLPSHGPSRAEVWHGVSHSSGSCTMAYAMKRIGSYPTTLSITQKFSLEELCLHHEICIENTGETRAPVNCAIHYYWHSPMGWDSVLLNDERVSDVIKADDSIDLSSSTTISIAQQPSISLNASENLKKVQLWTGRVEREDAIEYDQDYVCIEPVLGTGSYFGSRDSMLSPNSKRCLRCSIALK